MSYLDLDEEEEYDLICKFEDYYAKHIENQDACTSKKKKDSNIINDVNIKREEKNEKRGAFYQSEKPKRTFARSKFISTKNCDNKNETIPTLYYY